MVRKLLNRSLNEYGMLVVLVLLCIYYAWATVADQAGVGSPGGKQCAGEALAKTPLPHRVAIVSGSSNEDAAFVEAAKYRLENGGITAIGVIQGDPTTARKSLQQSIASSSQPEVIITTAAGADWLPRVIERLPALASVSTITPKSYRWPTFLMSSNLLNVANNIVVIAIIAVGMTMVIITGGIDLSVGSLVALSAVVTGIMIRDHAGGEHASAARMIECCLVGILACSLVGAFSGAMVTLFGVPSFITTLAMMRVTSGIAFIVAGGQSVYGFPSQFTWLGRGFGFLGIPNAVWLMGAIFIVAQITMSRTRLGRYIYAVGGNQEAARLSGVPVGRVLMIVYILTGLFAGVSGVVVASQLNSASPTYGLGYELSVIAAVVVGGTSLAGGEGKIFGTLIGALIIAVIQNGMNLTGVESYRQMIVLGVVILGAVLLDRLKRKSWRFPARLRSCVGPTGDGVESPAAE